MKTNTKCQSKTTSIQCDTDYPDYFQTTIIWGGRKRTITECLAHAAASEERGSQVELIDMR